MKQFCLVKSKLFNLNKYCLYFLLLLLFSLPNNSFSQTDSLNVYDLSLSQLSKLKITAASKTIQDIREISSTIFVITTAQIKENGYFT